MSETILLSVDLGEPSSWDKALPEAIALCRAKKAPLYVVTVVPEFGFPLVGSYFPDDFEQKALDEARRQLEIFVQEQVPGDVTVFPVVRQGTVYREILEAAEEIKASLIVITAHRPDLRDYLIGPNAARVVRHADCSVLVVRH